MKHWRGLAFVVASIAGAVICGCIGEPNVATTQPATAVDFATTQPTYWLSQEPVQSVEANNFQKLWDACDSVARDYFFPIDRTDYRTGLMTTRPVTSSQFFEPWRRELQTPQDVAYSSTAATRRTIRFEISRRNDGTFELNPKVLVERESLSEQRATSVVLSSNPFKRSGPVHDLPYGTKETDQGIALQSRYWYLIGRDFEFEKVLARAVKDKLRG